MPIHITDTSICIYQNKEIKDKNGQVPTNLIFKYDNVLRMDSVESEIYNYVGKRIFGDVMEDIMEQFSPMVRVVLIKLML